MGRGLSPLQQQILRLAWQRAQTPAAPRPQRVLFAQEIFVRLYHWPISHPAAAVPFARAPDGLAFRQAFHFQPAVIGPRRYRAAMVSVHRALGRLQTRGLLTRVRMKWAIGWGLTDAGRAVAGQLLVD